MSVLLFIFVSVSSVAFVGIRQKTSESFIAPSHLQISICFYKYGISESDPFPKSKYVLKGYVIYFRLLKYQPLKVVKR